MTGSLGKDKFLGSYVPGARKTEMLRHFEKLKCWKRQNRKDYQRDFEEPLPEPKDPLLETLKDILKEISSLKEEVDVYSLEHINQDFRRINASLMQCQLKLDRVNVDGREDARQLRKEGIRNSELGANTLMEKIHSEDYRECSQCLKL